MIVGAIIMPVTSNQLATVVDAVTVVTEGITPRLLFDPLAHELLLKA